MNESKIFAGEISGNMSFNEKVWVLSARFPSGRAMTDGDIACKLGSNGTAPLGTLSTRIRIPQSCRVSAL
jgi:hypothetical protein